MSQKLLLVCFCVVESTGESRGRMQGGVHPPPPQDDLQFSKTTGFLQTKKTMWFIGVEVEQETSAPPPKKILHPPLERALFTVFSIFCISSFSGRSSMQHQENTSFGLKPESTS